MTELLVREIDPSKDWHKFINDFRKHNPLPLEGIERRMAAGDPRL